MNHEPAIEPAPDWAGFDRDLRGSPDLPEAGTAADLDRFAIDGVPPERVVRPTSVPQVCRVMKLATTGAWRWCRWVSVLIWGWAGRRDGRFLRFPSRH